MHETALADKTIQRALEIGAICKPFGCKAIVNNPDPLPGSAEKTDSELKIETESSEPHGTRSSRRRISPESASSYA